MYIYTHVYISISLSLSIYIYIYIYTYTRTYLTSYPPRQAGGPKSSSERGWPGCCIMTASCRERALFAGRLVLGRTIYIHTTTTTTTTSTITATNDNSNNETNNNLSGTPGCACASLHARIIRLRTCIRNTPDKSYAISVCLSSFVTYAKHNK